MIRLENLSKYFGTSCAVDRLNLSVAAGEIFGFIGPNGAGKTTTIRMMGGLLAPSQGHVFIDNIDMDRKPEAAKHKIGLIPDRPYLYEKLTAMEFLKFTADLFELSANGFDARVRQLLEMFALVDRAHELIEAYSHGMKQRLIMAAALLRDPPLIIVDEPMVGLDPRGIRMVRDMFRELAGKGTTVFISTHTLDLAETVCDRIGVIQRGKLIATGTLAELKTTARLQEGDLEQVFFELTEESASA